MKTRTIRQTVTLKASPHEVYEALVDSRKHSKLTGAKAIISRKVGGKFSIYVGDITGTNPELVQDKKIMQSWRIVMEGWPDDYFSQATFSMKAVKDGTRLDFTQSGVPEECYESVSQGWYDYYWNPIKEMLENRSVS
ncbi:MAG: SRPBCC domain-containing protein [Thaumarchaeota archaeon]|nr:SRPBCC domain-containing protein [Nitrososphaerota archaeon]